jgi:hypothetical protein
LGCNGQSNDLIGRPNFSAVPTLSPSEKDIFCSTELGNLKKRAISKQKNKKPRKKLTDGTFEG